MNILARKWWSAPMLQDVWRQWQNLDCSSAYRIHTAMHNSSGCLATMKPRCGSAYWKDTAMHSAANAPGYFAMMKSRCSLAYWKDPAIQNTSKTWACLKRCVNFSAHTFVQTEVFLLSLQRYTSPPERSHWLLHIRWMGGWMRNTFPLGPSSWELLNKMVSSKEMDGSWTRNTVSIGFQFLAIFMNSPTDKSLPNTCVPVYVLNYIQTTDLGI